MGFVGFSGFLVETGAGGERSSGICYALGSGSGAEEPGSCELWPWDRRAMGLTGGDVVSQLLGRMLSAKRESLSAGLCAGMWCATWWVGRLKSDGSTALADGS